jgi:crossover junction endodeoxyribonuclease RuvC|tara:strand:+ start:2304 stop:2909 length:606 start_codon:yes stop_codon:yes gene_type:complete
LLIFAQTLLVGRKESKILVKEKIILGVDPGTIVMGYGIIKVTGSKIELLDAGVLSMKKEKDLGVRLKMIFDHMIKLIDQFLPDELAIEAQFFGENVQSMLKLGKAQGVAIAAALSRGIPFEEYAPKKIKMSITGKGTSSKEQVAGMLVHILKVKKLPEPLDATDALATAVCHYYQSNSPTGGKKYSGWDSFLKNNPGKLKD